MKFGLFGINNGPCAFPKCAASVARAAEDAGFESVWTGEHVILPHPQAPPSPVAADYPMRDAAGGAAAASPDCLRRTFQGGVQPGRAYREGMVRVCAGAGWDCEMRRGAANGVQSVGPSVRGRRDKHHAKSTSEGRSRYCEAL